MLIIPIENKPDWRRPPVVTLLLVLINCVIFFGYQLGDDERIREAAGTYQRFGLLEKEAELYVAYHEDRTGDTLKKNDPNLRTHIFWDLGFDQEVRKHFEDDDYWQFGRQEFEQARRRISWIGHSFISADPSLRTALSAMFLHGDFGHLFGNMLFLFIFGFALELLLGRLLFLFLYIATGLLAFAPDAILLTASWTPTIGASGAVSGLMGAYVATYGLRKIRFFYSVLVYFGELKAPALIILPLWIAKEIYGWAFTENNIAYWAHAGGLMAGALVIAGMKLHKRAIDTEILEQPAVSAKNLSQHRSLDQYIDSFQFDRARILAEQMLSKHPEDTDLQRKYISILATKPDQPDYHRAVHKLLTSFSAAAATLAQREALASITQTYLAGTHPKPALKDRNLRCRLAKLLAEQGLVEAAMKLSNQLLKENDRDTGLLPVLTSLSRALDRAGHAEQAAHYRQLHKQLAQG